MTEIHISNNGRHINLIYGENCPESLTSLLRMMAERYQNNMMFAEVDIKDQYASAVNSDEFVAVMKMAYNIEVKHDNLPLMTFKGIPESRCREVPVSMGNYFFVVTNKKTKEKAVAIGQRMNDALTHMGLKPSDYMLGGEKNKTLIHQKRHLYTNLSWKDIAALAHHNMLCQPLMPCQNEDESAKIYKDEGGAEYGITEDDNICYCLDDKCFVIFVEERDY
jgi:hypothetical protein